MNAFDPTKSANVDDLDSVEKIDKLFETLTPEAVKEMAKNFGAPDALYDLLLEMKRDDFCWTEFVYKAVKYWFYAEFIFSGNELKPTGRWLLRSEQNGSRKNLSFSDKEEFLAAPVFDSKTIEEIADKIPRYELSREPVIMFE